jgi:hypothetical protein
VIVVEQDRDNILQCYESPADDSLELVWQELYPGNYWSHYIGVGDVNGDSVLELAVVDSRSARLYHAVGNDDFVVVWEHPDCYAPATLYDVDRDGRDDLICHSGDYQVTILRQGGLGVADRPSTQRREQLLPPSVTRGAPVRVAGIAAGEVEVVDAAGRIVAKPRDGVWNPRGVAPGAYFVRVRSESQAVVRKVLVLR